IKGEVMLFSFVRGGPLDLQRSYNGQSHAPFAEVFTRAASYTLGLVGAAAGHSETALMVGGGLHNLVANPKLPASISATIPRTLRLSHKAFGIISVLCLRRWHRSPLEHFREIRRSPRQPIALGMHLVIRSTACRTISIGWLHQCTRQTLLPLLGLTIR